MPCIELIPRNCRVVHVHPAWYNPTMKATETVPAQASYVGHVKNGVVVLDAQVALDEGQAVRVEPIALGKEHALDTERAARVQQLQQLFAEWTEEDGKLTGEEADRLRTALERSRGLGFRAPTLD